MQKLKKIKLKIPVPKKYFISVSLCNVSCFGAVNNINPSRIMAEDQTRNVTTSIGASPYAYKCYIPADGSPKCCTSDDIKKRLIQMNLTLLIVIIRVLADRMDV